jgi:DNA-binding beta-propeller fold protein YncE
LRQKRHPGNQKNAWVATAPAGALYTSIDREGATVIPNGRLITPAGKQITVAPHPFGLAISRDGRTIITANSGTGPFSISIITDYNSTTPVVKQIPETMNPEEGLLEAVFMGLAISSDNKMVYVAGGQENKVYIFDLTTNKKVGEILCNKFFDRTDYNDGYIGDMVLAETAAGCMLWIDCFRMIVKDTKTKVIHNVKTGRYPLE